MEINLFDLMKLLKRILTLTKIEKKNKNKKKKRTKKMFNELVEERSSKFRNSEKRI